MAQAQHRVAIRLGMDGALEVKQGLRDVGEAGSREMGKLAQGAQVAQRAFSLLAPCADKANTEAPCASSPRHASAWTAINIWA